MTSGSGTRQCVSCGRSIAFDANVCQYCGHDYRAGAPGAAPAKKKSALPLVGGILIIIAGILELITGVSLIAGGSALIDISFFDFGDIFVICGAIWALFGLIALLGGFFAIKREHFGLAVLGGILGLGGYFILALIGLILIAISREEFE